jgi:hypothetical protein
MAKKEGIDRARNNTGIEAIAAAAFNALREMDARCPMGLCNYTAISPYAGRKRKDEHAITWGVTEALASKWNVPSCMALKTARDVRKS